MLNDAINEIRGTFPFNEPLYVILVIIVAFSLILFVSFILLTFIAKVKVTLRINIILNLLVVNFIQTLSYILNYSFEYEKKYYLYIENDFLCAAQSIILISFSMSRDFWILIISYVTYENVVKNNYFKLSTTIYFIFFCVLGYLVPAGIILFYKFNKVLGICELNCWIRKENVGKAIFPGYSLFVYIFKFVLISGVIVFTVLIMQYLLQVSEKDRQMRKEVKKFGWKMLMFPLVQIVTGLFPSIYTFLLSFFDSQPYFMKFATLFFGCIQGILFPLCYLFNSEIKTVFIKKTKNEDIDDNIEEKDLLDESSDF